ncbi:hypothetical protein L1987_76912 [Smallanthus sonchifolius]|uniref:Uncharacterized protein n=1 Tax=Smallanthus sonchifolius TaxID=185202 RepID=A0ACB8Z9D1_9ASTR|nr:hypothetical protein L1987_76912 [Smallanthus sonchifolius]
MQWKSTSSCYQAEDEEDMDVDTTNSWTPATESSAGKEKKVNVDTDAATSSGSREGKAEEIGLLTDLYNLHNKTGRYLLSDKRDFYKFWIEEEHDYANKKELDEKMNELHARFLKNMDKNVEGPVDPIDVEILRLSHWIWGSEIDSSDETDDDQEQDLSHVDSKDSTKESGPVNKPPNGNGSAAS